MQRITDKGGVSKISAELADGSKRGMSMVKEFENLQKQFRGLRAAIYNRCSTEKEVQENAIIIQEQESVRVCEEKGWEIVHIYKELESGRYADTREEYQQLLVDVSLDKFDIIVVKSQDRIMRNLGDWCHFVELINEYDIQLYFYLDNKFYDYEKDDMLYGFTMQMHAFYSKNLAMKIRQSHKTRQMTRAHVNTNNIYGWDRIDMYTFIINESEAGYIRRAYELLREGNGFHTIANLLYCEGARSKKAGLTYRDRKSKKIKYYSDKISPTTWRKILYSPNVYGTAIMNKQTKPLGKRRRINNPEDDWIFYENAFPAIVSKEYYEESIAMHQNSMAVQNCSIKKDDRTMSKRGKHLWSGKLICACCGSKYYRMKVSHKNAAEEIKWRCSKISTRGAYSENNPTGCRNVVIEEKRLKELLAVSVEKQFGHYLNHVSGILEKALMDINRIFQENDMDNELVELEVKLADYKKKKETLLEKLIGEVISDADFAIFNEKLSKEIVDLEEREKVLNERKNAYNNSGVRLSQIRDCLGKNIIRQVGLEKVFDTISVIRIHTDGKCELRFDKHKLLKLLSVFNRDISDNQLDNQLDKQLLLEFVYNKPTAYELRRMKTNQLVLAAFRANPYLTIQGAAEQLNEKYSYIYTSVAMLRKEGRLQYNKRKAEQDGIWIVQPDAR